MGREIRLRSGPEKPLGIARRDRGPEGGTSEITLRLQQHKGRSSTLHRGTRIFVPQPDTIVINVTIQS